jgi:cullin 3
MASGVKNLRGKPFNIATTMDSERAQECWLLLSRAVDKIYSFQYSELSYEELYRNAYNLCISKQADMLYKNIGDKIREFNVTLQQELVTTNDFELLSKLLTKWTDYKKCLTMIRDILLYMDKTHVQTKKLKPVYDVGLECFRDVVVSESTIIERGQKLLLESI